MSHKITNWLLFALHICVAVVVIGAVWSHYSTRMVEHQRIETQAQEAKQRSALREKDVEVNKAVLGGLQEDDPYVIEKIARERYDYTGPKELSPASH